MRPDASWRAALLAIPILLLGTAISCEEEPVCVHDPPLTWENAGEPFLDTFCTGCHSSLLPEGQRNDAPVEVNFDTYAGVLEWHSRVVVRTDPAFPSMPPAGGPTELQYELFQEWLSCEVAEDIAQIEEGK